MISKKKLPYHIIISIFIEDIIKVKIVFLYIFCKIYFIPILKIIQTNSILLTSVLSPLNFMVHELPVCQCHFS